MIGIIWEDCKEGRRIADFCGKNGKLFESVDAYLTNPGLKKIGYLLLDTAWDDDRWRKIISRLAEEESPPVVMLAVDPAKIDRVMSGFEPNVVRKIIPKPVNLFVVKAIIDDILFRHGISEINKVDSREEILINTLKDLFRLNDELLKKNNALAKANDLKSAFLSSFSHELRTPLTVIIGYNEVLLNRLRDRVDPSYYGFLENIKGHAGHLLLLINNLLDLSKIEAGKMDMKLESFTLSEFVEDMAKYLDGLLLRTDLKKSYDIKGENVILNTDYNKLKQVMINLLGNAAKYCPTGLIEFSTAIDGEHAVFKVRDTGPGIRPEDLPLLFEAFKQGSREEAGKTIGTGLGLAISKKLVDLLGGTIGVDSEVGIGSIFTVEIPIDLANTKRSVAPLDSADLKKLDPQTTVVVIDDDASVQSHIEAIAFECGFTTVRCTSAREGLRLLNQFNPAYTFVDVDIEYPSFDELTRIINPHCTNFIALTLQENNREFHHERVLTSLMKPLDSGRIGEILKGQKREKASVLMIDDDIRTTRAYSRILYKRGHTVLLANSAEEAFIHLGQTRVDLICIDLMMPSLSGFDFISQVRTRIEYQRIPIVAISGKHLSKDEKDFLADYDIQLIEKAEFNAKLLQKTVEKALTVEGKYHA